MGTSRQHAELSARSAGQERVVTRAQLAEHGVDRHAVRTHVRAGRWQGYGAKVVVLGNDRLTGGQLRWAAVLSQPRGAALAGLTAATLGGLTGFATDEIDVLLPHGARPVRIDGVRPRVSRRYSQKDVHPTLSPPRVRIERALVDAAFWEPWSRRSCAILAAGVQQRLTTAARLRHELAGAGGVKRARLFAAVIDDIAGGAASLAEIDAGTLCRKAGLPPPLRQVVRRDASGRRRYLDVGCDGFTLEVDGGFHLGPLTWLDDSVRHNDLVIAGERVLRVPSVLIRVAPDVVVEQLRRAHQRFGSLERSA